MINKSKKVIKFRKRKIRVEDNCEKNIINKFSITYTLLALFDIVMVIFFASKNKVHYVEMLGKEIFVGDTKNLYLGRGYINLIITAFFCLYFYIVNRFYLKNKLTWKILLLIFLSVIIINLILFFIFTNRVY